MSSSKNTHFDNSLKTGKKAFDCLVRNTIPVWPEMYEVLYAYEFGQNVAVRSAIDILKKNGDQLQADDIKKIYYDHFSKSRLLDASEDIGSKINEEIRKIIDAMAQAGERSDECEAALRKIETKFENVSTASQLQSVVEILSGITRAMADNNHNLNTKLKQSTRQIEVLHKDLEKARDESNTDALTGLANRMKFDRAMRDAFSLFNKDDNALSLLLVDIDHFKKFNDTYGHQTGDQILRLVSNMLKSGLKGRDLPARYGGEEFGIILPGTSSKDAFTVAEQIRKAIAAKELIKRSTGENLGNLTVSIGIAEALPGDTPSSLIERSDKALYKAKEAGRNRCEIAPENTDRELSGQAT